MFSVRYNYGRALQDMAVRALGGSMPISGLLTICVFELISTCMESDSLPSKTVWVAVLENVCPFCFWKGCPKGDSIEMFTANCAG